LVSKRLNQKPAQADHSQLISRGYLVLGVALVALLVIPFLTGNSSQKELTGKAATVTIHEEYLPRGIEDEYFEEKIMDIGKENTFLKCKEQDDKVTFLFQQARVTGKNNVPRKIERVFKNGCFGDNLVTYECDPYTYKSCQYGTGASLANEDANEDIEDILGANKRNEVMRSDPDSSLEPHNYLCYKTPGPKQLTTICANGCANKKCK
jgi:hypothetical protein